MTKFLIPLISLGLLAGCASSRQREGGLDRRSGW